MTISSSAGRDGYLLGGRRVRISDLVAAGLLEAESKLRFDRKRFRETHIATVRHDGRIEISGGRVFKTPSGAAKAVAGGIQIDGWHAWRVDGTEEMLDTLRQRLLDDAAASLVKDDADSEAGELLVARHTFLKHARENFDQGQPLALTVRALLGKWGATTRPQPLTERIDAELENHGLTTQPKYLQVGLDETVSIVELVEESELSEESTGVLDVIPDASPRVPHVDVGLKLSNILSARAGVEWVTPHASLDEVITKMLLNDYSQLAVMSNDRSPVVRAVTWQSIARARHANSSTDLDDVVVGARDFPGETDLIDVLPAIQTDDFVFVRGEQNRITGIVTTADVVGLYGELAAPFFLIGELDQLLRRVVRENFELGDVDRCCGYEGDGKLKTFDDLSMGDYQRVLEIPENWSTVAWPIDRRSFIERLEFLRGVRNDVMHFNPDATPGSVVDRLRSMIGLIRKYIQA